jgi:hypothetical protein
MIRLSSWLISAWNAKVSTGCAIVKRCVEGLLRLRRLLPPAVSARLLGGAATRCAP